MSEKKKSLLNFFLILTNKLIQIEYFHFYIRKYAFYKQQTNTKKKKKKKNRKYYFNDDVDRCC